MDKGDQHPLEMCLGAWEGAEVRKAASSTGTKLHCGGCERVAADLSHAAFLLQTRRCTLWN